MSALSAPAAANITHQPIGIIATATSRHAPCSSGIGSPASVSGPATNRTANNASTPTLTMNSPTAKRIAAITSNAISGPLTPNATPPANINAKARCKPSATSANPSSVAVVTLTAATALANAHGNSNSPTAAPTSRPNDSAG